MIVKWRKVRHKWSSPSNSMNVRFYSCGEIKVDDVGDILEVHPSGDSILLVLRPLKTAFRNDSKYVTKDLQIKGPQERFHSLSVWSLYLISDDRTGKSPRIRHVTVWCAHSVCFQWHFWRIKVSFLHQNVPCGLCESYLLHVCLILLNPAEQMTDLWIFVGSSR